MSIPLDRLYHYLKNFCSDDTIIYRWFPHGSKKLSDLLILDSDSLPSDKYQHYVMHSIIFHDQEPLNYNYYSHSEFLQWVLSIAEERKKQLPYPYWCYSNEYLDSLALSHLRTKTIGLNGINDFVLLCHSEKNSQQLKIYEDNGFLGVYYWCHAIIARDWFRYAQHDCELVPELDCVKHDFLIYNRAWSGTREYRLKFAELIANNQLLDKCKMNFSATDENQHYTNFKFQNSALGISRFDLEFLFPQNTADSNSSADYNSDDYKFSAIEVVLETLFDDSRWHLTEKTLRAIACGRPFILASTPGALQYLRSYGFKTFDGLINEDYDNETDPLIRLHMIIEEMQRISSLPQIKKIELWQQLYDIANQNKQLFFSDNFHNNIINEFSSNYQDAMKISRQNVKGKWWLAARALDGDAKPIVEMSIKIDQILSGK